MVSTSWLSRFFFCVLAAGLVATIAATPLDAADDSESEVSVLWNRGATSTGKYVGSKCRASTECFSGNCADGVCARQVKGGACFKNANCQSYNCYGTTASNKKCSAPSKIYGTCDAKNPCKKGLTCTDAGICKYGVGTRCSNNKQCSMDNCQNGVCQSQPPRAPTRPNQICSSDAECASGHCVDSSTYDCEDTSGNPISCPSTGYYYYEPAFVCTRFPVGHTCSNQGECENSVCKSGKCVELKNGDACTLSSQCPSSSLCENGKCAVVAQGSLYPNEICSTNAQCLSNSCKGDVAYKDLQGVNNGIDGDGSYGGYGGYGPGRKRDILDTRATTLKCDYLQDGEKGCRTLFDCALQLCLDGVCKFGQVGDSCTINYQCNSKVCSTEGKCIDPPAGANLSAGVVCYSGDQCVSGTCTPAPIKTVYRPSLQDPNVLAGEKDFTCEASGLNEPCNTSADCAEGQCLQGVCANPPPATTSTTATPAPSVSTTTVTVTVTSTATVTVTATATATGASTTTKAKSGTSSTTKAAAAKVTTAARTSISVSTKSAARVGGMATVYKTITVIATATATVAR
ncbi:hypothetical protein OC835_007029 [Tilletia horrida]|nr:hypothetical protein OC835_007029 [Tilletia horrida]